MERLLAFFSKISSLRQRLKKNEPVSAISVSKLIAQYCMQRTIPTSVHEFSSFANISTLTSDIFAYSLEL